MKMIKIHGDNPSTFVLIAPFLDHPETQVFILQMRDQLALKEQFISTNDFNHKHYSVLYSLSKEESIVQDEQLERYEMLKNRSWKSEQEEQELKMLEEEITNWTQPRYLLEKSIHTFLKRFDHGEEFSEVLYRAIFSDEVFEADFKGRPSRDRADQVVRDRKWFWMNIPGIPDRKGYQAIAKLEGIPNKRTVENAIKSYKERIARLGVPI